MSGAKLQSWRMLSGHASEDVLSSEIEEEEMREKEDT